jgi:tetratricopeptide (TPR) repeat protein
MSDQQARAPGPEATPPPGGTVAGFRLGEKLGEGGMGVVFRAAGPDGAPAAVKLLNASGTSGHEAARRFEREAQIRIEHPNVCRVLEAGRTAEGTPFLAMELLEGESLEQRLRRGPLSAAEAADVGTQVCRGLAAAHAAGVVHRDLKPSNLFLCRSGTVKLFDFGIALFGSGEQARLTTVGTVLGTPWYLSPEQARGQADLDHRTDLWSLGVVLWEAVVGRTPFARETPLASVVAVLMEDPPPLAQAAPGVPAPLAAVIERALRKPMDERWATAQAFGQAIASADLSFAATMSLPVMGAALSIPPGEQRVVALLLAEGVQDRTRLERAVQEQGGLFLPLLGNRALGLFGGEAWEGDEVRRAAHAARAARPAAMRVAVASGRAAHGGAGVEGAVLRAAEAGCVAGAIGVAVSAAAARALGRELPLQPLRGDFWELPLGEPTADGEAELEDEGPAAVVGRQAELAQIRQCLEGVLGDRRAQAVLLTGPPGIGKTRLRREAERLLGTRAPQAHSFTGRGQPLRRETAFALLVSALHERARVGVAQQGWPRLEPGAPEDERRAAVWQLIAEATGATDPLLGWAEPFAELLGVELRPGTGGTAVRDPQVVRDRFRLALQDYFAALCERSPTALFLEDLQWADAASLELVEDLLDRLAGQPLLVLATARPELTESGREPFVGLDVARIALRGLGPTDTARLAGAVAGRSLSEGLLRAVVERTAGNPLFVRELLLELRERELLDRQGEGDELPLPLTIEAAVQSRLDHLHPAEKDLCKRAAVLGRPFTVVEVAALGAGDAEQTLDSLARKEIVLASRARARASGAREYQFRSTLVQDVAYRMLADEPRVELHRRAAAHLSAAPQAEPEEVAVHWEKGGDGAQAARWYRDAALAAATRGDSATVVRCAEKALALGPPPERRYELHRDFAIALGYLGRREEQERQIAVAIAMAPDEGARAHMLADQADLLWRTGRGQDALGVAALAAEAARRADDAEALTLVLGWQIGVLAGSGRLPEARRALVEAELLDPRNSLRARAFLADRRAMLAAAEGDLLGRREAFRAAMEAYHQAGDLRRAVWVEVNLADVHNRVGAYDDAIAALTTAVEGSRRLGLRSREGWAMLNLGYALVMIGKPAESVAALAQAETLARSSRDARLATAARIYRLRALRAEHRLPEAVAEAARAVTEAEAVGSPVLLVLALVAAARTRLEAGDPGSALELSRRAHELCEKLGGIEEDEAEVYLVHARVLLANGLPEDARRVHARGRERLWEIASKIGDLSWRARFLRDVPLHRALVETDEFR